MDFLRKHLEKLILGLMLLVLILSVLILLRSFQATRVQVREAEQQAEGIVLRGNQLELMKPSAFTALGVLEDQGLEFGMLLRTPDDNLKGSLIEPPRYIVCAGSDCHNLIPFTAKFCPICGEEQPPEKEGLDQRDDEDQDGIADFDERRIPFLNPRDPTDARLDQDNDTFLNVEEYRAGTDMADPTSFPPLAHNLRIVKTFRKTVPVGLRRISKNGSDDPANWDVSFTVQEPNRPRPRTRLARIGASVGGYTVVSARFEPGKEGQPEVPVAVIKSDETGEEYELKPDQVTYEKDLYGHFVFLNSRLLADFQRRRIMQFARKVDEEIPLRHLASRTIQTYRLSRLAQEGDTPVAEVVRIDAENQEGGAAQEPIPVKRFNPREDFVMQTMRSGGMGMEMDMMDPGMEDPAMMDPTMNPGRQVRPPRGRMMP